eukprot:Hpha_TRINITY_DN23941_c0_g1::TRINITY_DN23941_c0_g1_i1::g.137737::m.137737
MPAKKGGSKPAAKKAAAKKPAAKKAGVQKPQKTKKAAVKKSAVLKKSPVKKAAAKKPVTKKPAVKKAVVKKPPQKKPSSAKEKAGDSTSYKAKFISALQAGNTAAAIEVGITVLDRNAGVFGHDAVTNCGMQATLASLLVNRGEAGDFARAALLTRGVLANLPPPMAGARHRLQYDLGMALVKLAGEDGPDAPEFEDTLREAFKVSKAISPAASPEAQELKAEVLSSLYMAMSPVGRAVSVASINKHIELQEEVCRELVKWDTSNQALAKYNLGAVLCRRGELEEGSGLYESALKLVKGNKALKTQIERDLGVAKEQLKGRLPKKGVLVAVKATKVKAKARGKK